MLGLVTDRTQSNIDRLNELHRKGWNKLTEEEKREWTGDPFLWDGGVNLFSASAIYSDGVDIAHRNRTITATARYDGVYLYAVVIVGEAAKYTNKTFTLSVEKTATWGNATAQIATYWHDGTGFDYAGASIVGSGSMTFTTDNNPNNREYLALYIYVATDKTAVAGDRVRYEGVMLETGDVPHEYVPYVDIIPTAATKGAYNYSDLNRVERIVAELAARAEVELVTKTNWTMWDLPKKSDMDRFLKNVAMIRSLFPLGQDSPALPTDMNKLTYTAANNIEKILEELDVVISNVFHCGELYLGEV